MSKVLFTNPIAYTMNNGVWASPIFPTWGCRQGCTYLPVAFIFSVEISVLAIRQNDRIIGFQIGNSHIKCGQFADDLWTTLRSVEALNNTLLCILRP